MGREKIFNRQPERFENRDLTTVLASWKLTEFGCDVGRRPATFGDSHDYIARFLECRCERVNEQSGALNKRRVEFALRGPARTDSNHMGAVSDPLALDHRSSETTSGRTFGGSWKSRG